MWIHITDRQPPGPGLYRVRRYGPRKHHVEDEMRYDGRHWRTYMGHKSKAVVTWWEGAARWS